MFKQYGKRRAKKQRDTWAPELEISDTSFDGDGDNLHVAPGAALDLHFGESPGRGAEDLLSLELVALELPKALGRHPPRVQYTNSSRARESARAHGDAMAERSPLAPLSPNVHRMVYLDQAKPRAVPALPALVPLVISLPMDPRKQVTDDQGRMCSAPMATTSLPRDDLGGGAAAEEAVLGEAASGGAARAARAALDEAAARAALGDAAPAALGEAAQAAHARSRSGDLLAHARTLSGDLLSRARSRDFLNRAAARTPSSSDPLAAPSTNTSSVSLSRVSTADATSDARAYKEIARARAAKDPATPFSRVSRTFKRETPGESAERAALLYESDASRRGAHRRSLSTSILELEAVAKGKKLFRRMSLSFRAAAPATDQRRASMSLGRDLVISLPMLTSETHTLIEEKFGRHVAGAHPAARALGGAEWGEAAPAARAAPASPRPTLAPVRTPGSSYHPPGTPPPSHLTRAKRGAARRAPPGEGTSDASQHAAALAALYTHVGGGPVPFDEAVSQLLPRYTILKLSDSTFSEVFLLLLFSGAPRGVLKIIPCAAAGVAGVAGVAQSVAGAAGVAQPTAGELLQELKLTQMMTAYPGYAKYRLATIVQGAYPSLLLSLWDRYAHTNGTESTRPAYPSTQLYLVLELEYAGTDLERFHVRDWCQAAEIFFSVVRTLVVGETEVRFEHRDLHWGNVVIFERVDYEKISKGEEGGEVLEVSVIDYTLARAEQEEVVYTELEEDLFGGKNDYQFEVYRLMREAARGRGSKRSRHAPVDWSLSHPTNPLWLHYLLDRLTLHKHLIPLDRDAPTPQGRNPHHSTDLERETRCFAALVSCMTALNPKRPGGASFATARDFLQWATTGGFVDM